MMMDILVTDTIAVAGAKGLGIAKLLLLRSCYSTTNLSITDSYTEQSSSSPSPRVLQISAVILPVDALAPPPVKSNTYRMPRRTLVRRKRRANRRLSGDDSGDIGDEGFFFGDGGDRPFGGGGNFGGSGGGWNFNGFGEGHNWDDSSSSYSDPAFDFVYQVLSWIMLSNCLHFALKKILRVASDGIVDANREKDPRRLASTC